MLRRVLIFTLLVTGLAIWLVAKVCRTLLAPASRIATFSLVYRASGRRPDLDRDLVPVADGTLDLV